MPRKSATEKPNCHIHDKDSDFEVEDIPENVCVNDELPTEHTDGYILEVGKILKVGEIGSWEDDIRENVCVNDELTKHTDGNHYCLFHLPTKDKDIAKFEEIFQARLNAVEKKVAEVEKLPEEEHEEAKREISYDFRYVWFPSDVDLSDYKFAAAADFRSATFAAGAFFSSATFTYADFSSANFAAYVYFSEATFADYTSFSEANFSADSDFSSTNFAAYVYFSEATFAADADFSSTNFTADAYFSEATFTANADFRWATFATDAYFSKTTFAAVADFRSAKFLETSQVFFQQTRFCKTVDFVYSVFAGYVAFEGTQNNRLFTDEKSLLDLQNARIDDAKKISFHTVRLEPSWFVNTDASEFVFTDCDWYYADDKPLDVNRELQNLRDRKFENPYALLMKACWHLADNYEESKSFRRASVFRQMANESGRLETPWYFQPLTLHWWYYLSSRYGESWVNAFIVLLMLILLVFPLGYAAANFQVCPNDKPLATSLTEDKSDDCRNSPEELCNCRKRGLGLLDGDALLHSLTTATFQNVEHRKPVSFWSELLVILEKIFVPLQAALLALAIRRKFMR